MPRIDIESSLLMLLCTAPSSAHVAHAEPKNDAAWAGCPKYSLNEYGCVPGLIRVSDAEDYNQGICYTRDQVGTGDLIPLALKKIEKNFLSRSVIPIVLGNPMTFSRDFIGILGWCKQIQWEQH